MATLYCPGREAQTLVPTNRKTFTSEAKRQRERADLAERQLAQMLAANPRPEIPRRNGGTVYERLDTYGIPVDDLREAVRMEAGQMVQEALSPIARGFEARNGLMSQYPDYNKYEADVAQFIAQDPEFQQEYNEMFRVAPRRAMELAFLKFGEEKRRTHKASGGERQTAREATEAAIPSGRTGSGARGGPDPYEEQLREAYQRMQTTGSRADREAFVRLRLKKVVTDDHLNQ